MKRILDLFYCDICSLYFVQWYKYKSQSLTPWCYIIQLFFIVYLFIGISLSRDITNRWRAANFRPLLLCSATTGRYYTAETLPIPCEKKTINQSISRHLRPLSREYGFFMASMLWRATFGLQHYITFSWFISNNKLIAHRLYWEIVDLHCPVTFT